MSVSAHKVIVGYDTSQESQAALHWAAVVAQRRKASLLVVSATGTSDRPNPRQDPSIGIVGERIAYEMAEEGAKFARKVAPDIRVDAIGILGEVLPTLEQYSHDAQLIVVGHRGIGGIRGALIGSVAHAISTHAKCPVAVVRESYGVLPTPDYPSVVGIDGSPQGNVALDQAAEWAAEAGNLLRIVVAWHAHSGALDAEEKAIAIARAGGERAQRAHPEVRVEHFVGEGRPSEVVIEAARDASLIIVGARGRGEFASLLLGSVSREIIQHAHCAVYIVR